MTNESANLLSEKEGGRNVFCFGELLLRMSPSLERKWIQQAQMPVYIGGAELNVAIALAKWNTPAKYCTALPAHYLSTEIIEELNEKNIDTTAIHFSGNRIGTYYLPQGADLKNAGVIYDRAYSSFADLNPGMINWEKVLDGCRWFHFSAISPALNENVAAVCKEALMVAKAKGLTISVDLNYRAKLWQYGKQPVEIMPELVQYCDVIMGNLWAVESLLGISSPLKESAGKTKEELTQATGESMLQIHKQYPQAGSIAYTFRLEKEYWAVLQHGPEMAVSKNFTMGQVVDKVGSGDCFMAGLIYGLYNKQDASAIINYAAAAAIGKLQEPGDATNQTIEQVKSRL
jgi:2-dehydro-3-deoxygluconokinase